MMKKKKKASPSHFDFGMGSNQEEVLKEVVAPPFLEERMIEKQKKETFAAKSAEGVGTICHSKCCCQFRRVELMLIGRCRCTYRKNLLVEMIVVNFRQHHH